MAFQPRNLVDGLRDETVTMAGTTAHAVTPGEVGRGFTATVEVDLPAIVGADRALAPLAAFDGSVAVSDRGWACATVTVTGSSLGQATSTALALVATALDAEPVSCRVTSVEEYDAGLG